MLERPPVLVASGTVVGTALRWAAETATTGDSTVLAILFLNVLGSATVGWLLGRDVPRAVWWFAGPGVAGGLTTFSSFALQAAQRLDGGQPAGAAGMTVVTVAFAVMAAAGGYVWGQGQQPTSGTTGRGSPTHRPNPEAST